MRASKLLHIRHFRKFNKNILFSQCRYITRDQLYIRHEPLETKDLIQAIDNAVEKFEYQSKYPDVTWEQIDATLKDFYSTKFNFSERFMNMATTILGYTPEEIEFFTTGKLPNPFDDEGNINWKLLKQAMPFDSEYTKKLFNDFEKATNDTRRLAAKEPPKEAELFDQINWEEYAKEHGQGVLKIKKDYEDAIKMFEHKKVDLEAVKKHFEARMTPHKEKLKDAIAEVLPTIKETKEKVLKRLQLLEKDEYGLEKYDWDLEVLDLFFPEVRDELIKQIEEGDWSPSFRDEIKKLPISTLEQAYTHYMKANESKRRNESEKPLLRQYETTGKAQTPKEIEHAKLFRSVLDIAIENNRLEQQNKQIKSMLEQKGVDLTTLDKAQGTGEKKKKVKKQITNKELQDAITMLVYVEKEGQVDIKKLRADAERIVKLPEKKNLPGLLGKQQAQQQQQQTKKEQDEESEE